MIPNEEKCERSETLATQATPAKSEGREANPEGR